MHINKEFNLGQNISRQTKHGVNPDFQLPLPPYQCWIFCFGPWGTPIDQARIRKGSENQNNIDKWLYCLCVASWICSVVLVGSQTQLFHASKIIFDVQFYTKQSSLFSIWFVYLFLSGIVGTFFLKRKVERWFPCKHVLWRLDIWNI